MKSIIAQLYIVWLQIQESTTFSREETTDSRVITSLRKCYVQLNNPLVP